ncbi:MAG: iron-sulfur cluster assembly scaffold protein [Dehalococcoidales bacterium]|nr:iron-sulfur cluster assembly scaffold protein [Dehalococcoidales bacterium]
MTDNLDEFEELMLGEQRRNYSAKTIDHAMNPRNLGVMENADVYATITGPCGDTMEIWLKIDGSTILSSSFMTDGCGTSIASGSMVTELATGKDIREAMAISQQDVLDALDGLPEESRHCALLASNTLKAALREYIDIKKEPWKKAYRRQS